jgi:hypothetical protein
MEGNPMSTNYYVYLADGTDESEVLHIGKSSMGWVFSLRVYPERGIRTLYDWLPILLDSQNAIRDEYGRDITVTEILRTITVRDRNSHTLIHGEGTWDYCDYEFF